MDNRVFIYDSPIGVYRVEYANGALLSLRRADGGDECLENGSDPFAEDVARQLTEYFCGERQEFDLAIGDSGCTQFQRRVYSELRKIPYGERRSYKQIAVAVGNPNASRAVGMANRCNPIHIITPCHRVIGSDGQLTGYAAGLDAKRFLLDLEQDNL